MQDNEFMTKVTEEDLKNAVEDDYGVKYSADGKRLLKANFDLVGAYAVKHGTEVICDDAFHNSVSIIGGYTGLKEIEIPKSVRVIGDSAFSGCSGLEDIEIPSSVMMIGDSAFGGCSGLRNIKIPNSVASIGKGAFSGCSGLTEIKVDESNKKYDSRGNCNAIIDSEANTLVQGCMDTVIPSTVVTIGERAFSRCHRLNGIDIPSSVTEIGERAFSRCSGLEKIDIPSSVTEIGDYAFVDCIGLKTIDIPSSVTEIGDSAFSRCSGLEKIDIPSSVTEIGDSAFYGCSGLKKIEIPKSVTEIGKRAFGGCRGFEKITVDECNPKYDSRGGCNAIIDSEANTLVYGCKNSVIPSTVTAIGERAFLGCSGLKVIELPNSVTAIGDSAFANCSDLIGIFVEKGNPKYDSRDNCSAIIYSKLNNEST